MAGLDPATHVFFGSIKDVGARDKPGQGIFGVTNSVSIPDTHPFGRLWSAWPSSGRVKRWPQPALLAQYSQVRQVSTE